MTSPTPYQLLPRLADDEYAALREDVEASGIRVPIDVDEAGTIIDGHHRAWIAADLGIDCPRREITGLTDEQKRTHAVAVNVHRRNLTREQRRDLVARLRTDGMSTRRIAEATGLPHRTVARDTEGVPTGTPVTGADGKTYPATKQVTVTERETFTVDPATGEVTPPVAQPKRRPLTDAFRDAAYDLGKTVERVQRLTDDDRFTRNARQVSQLSRGDLLRAADALAGVIQRLP